MTELLDGQVAIVTGGARGIGSGIAARLAAEGASVALWDRDFATENRGQGIANGPLQVTVDVADPQSVDAAFRTTLDALGRVDILVNNAGINGPVGDAWNYPLDAWQKVLAINLSGVFHCCRSVVPHMRENGYGRIANVASIAGKEGGPGISAYAASKAGVIGFTKSLARELAGTNVLANCIAPVITQTDLFSQMTAEHIAAAKAKIPMGRFLAIEEIAAMVAWMCSRECSFTTGFTFDISGGRATY